MSDELAMEIIENLTEELGEKELKIMALEKELEEQKKQKLEYYDLSRIKQYKLDWLHGVDVGYIDDWAFCPRGIVEMKLEGSEMYEDKDLVCKMILHYFGGDIKTHKEIMRDIAPEFDNFDWDEFYEEKCMDGEMACLVQYPETGEEAKYWCDF